MNLNKPEPQDTSDSLDFLSDSSELATLIRTFDWSATALGSIGQWSQSLRAIVGFIVRSPVPMVMLWGRAGVMIYNDAYAVFAGSRHPDQLGKSVHEGWPEMADFNANVLMVGLAGGKLSYKDEELTLDRGLGFEQVWMNLDYSPVLDDGGQPAGVIAIVIETTERVLADRRIAEEQDRQRQMLCQMPGFAGVVSGPDHVYEYVNDAYVRISERTEFIGRPFREVFADLGDQGFAPLLDQVYATGETAIMRAMELRLHGTARTQYIDFVFEPIRDASGVVRGVFIGGYETTEGHLANAALRRNEERYRSLFESMGEGFCIIEHETVPGTDLTDFRYVAVNPAFATSTGIVGTRGRTLREVLPGEADSWVDTYHTVLKSGNPLRFERKLVAQGRVLELYAFRIEDRSGRRVGVIFSDITARKRAEQARAESEARLRLVIEGAKDHAILTTDENGIITSWSQGAQAIFGWLPDEIIGQPSAILFIPEDRDEGADRWELATAAREGSAPDERWHLRKDGGRVFMNGTVHSLPDGVNSRPAGFLKIARDETERRRTDQALRQLNADLERKVTERTQARGITWQLSPDLLGALNWEGYFETSNPAWQSVLGWTEADVATMTIFELVHPDDVERTREGFALTQQGTPAIRFPNRFRCKDGSYRWISWVGVPEEGMVYCTGRDITEEKASELELERAQEALRQSQKMEAVGQLTGGLAHDFNNLLGAIAGNLELLELRMAQGRQSGLDRYISAAKEGTRRAAALTQRLLAFSRRQTLDPRPTEMNKLIAGMEELIRRTVGPAIEVEVVGAGGLWLTEVDQSQLENALLNLTINARDAIAGMGRITIETANKWLDERAARDCDLPAGQYVSLCVTDTGSGMTPEIIAKAFDPFFTTKPPGQGTGLGLSMIHGFVRQSGGQVRVYSEFGEGTTMCIYLPRFNGVMDAVDDGEALAAADEGHGEVILVIDDEESVRRLVVEVLQDAGYQVLEAGDGPDGLKILETDAKIDLLITDVGLPGGLNGRQVADAARTKRSALRVLFITGYAENAAVGNGHLAVGMEVITKPFGITELAGKVREMLDR